MDTKSLLISLATAVVASLVVVWAVGGQVGPQGPAGAPGKDGKFGALSGPDIPSSYLRVGGMATYSAQAALSNSTAATNTPCKMTSPAATSTLRFASLNVSTGSTTATGWFLSKGTGTGEATTTANQLGSYALASGLQGTMTYQGALSTVDPVAVFAPNSMLIWTIAGTAIADTTKFNGTCNAEWVAIP